MLLYELRNQNKKLVECLIVVTYYGENKYFSIEYYCGLIKKRLGNVQKKKINSNVYLMKIRKCNHKFKKWKSYWPKYIYFSYPSVS